jgi:hypothetical protein
MNRRGFLGALAGLPIAAVVQPRLSVPEISAPPTTLTAGTTGGTIGYHHVVNGTDRPVTITIHCDTHHLQHNLKRLEAAVARELRRRPMGLPGAR